MSDLGRAPSPPEAPGRRLLVDAAKAETAARHRVRAAVGDLALPGTARLSDYARAAVSRMTALLVGEIEAALVDRLGGTARELKALTRLEAAGLLPDAELTALLLRRAAEHRLALRLRPGDAPGPLHGLMGDADRAVGSAVAALLAGEHRRYDRFGEPAVARADLPAELQHRMVWMVAAAVRPSADVIVAAAATTLLAGYDEHDTVDARSAAVVRALSATGRLEPALLVEWGEAGHVAPAVAGLALRAEVVAGAAWDAALDAEGSRLALLLRAADLARGDAARLLTAWAGAETAAARIELLDGVDRSTAREALWRWRIDPTFAAAIAALEGG